MMNGPTTFTNPIILGSIATLNTQLGGQVSSSGSALTVIANVTTTTTVCYFPIQASNLPAGLYYINYYCVTGGTTTYYWAQILAITGTIVQGTTTATTINGYGVSMSNTATVGFAGRSSTIISNSAFITLNGSQSIAIGYLSGTATSNFSGSITATRIS